MEKKEIQAKDKREVESRSEMTRTRPVFVPAVDIYERNDALILMADMPGVGSEGVEIHLEDNELSLKGRVEEVKKDVTPVYHEYRSGDYHRSFTISNIIDQDKIEASMKNGVLRIILPKAESTKPKQIKVKSG